MEVLDCSNYFKSNDGFLRFMKLLKKNYEKHGYFYGNITLDNVSEKEKQAFTGFMKKDYKNNKKITINLVRFIQRLEETKFRKVNFNAVLDEYFGYKIIPANDIKKEYLNIQNQLFEKIISLQENTKVYLILKDMLNNTYYQMFNQYYLKVGKDTFEKTILNICNGINNLPFEKTRLAVFAANIMKNPHGFDIKTFTGKVFILFLAKLNKVQNPNSIEDISELLYNNNILLDDVSNMILCYNVIPLISTSKTDTSIVHKGWSEFFNNFEPIQISLYNLSKIDGIQIYNNQLFIVENPNVFTAILDSEKLKNKTFSIICTYGQLKLSAIIFLRLLIDNNITVYYSGDMDPEGITIADKIAKRCKKVEFIGFSEKQYFNNISDINISDSRIKMLDNVVSHGLKEISDLIKKHKKAAYEELNIDYIISFIKQKSN